MNTTLCEQCRHFFQDNHVRYTRSDGYSQHKPRFIDSPDDKRPLAQILSTTGCRLCKVILMKLKSLHPDVLSSAQTSNELVVFRLVIRPYWNTNLQWDEDIDRPFLQVSILHVLIEYRLWRLEEVQSAQATSDKSHDTGSETSFARAAEWLHECMMNHEDCSGVNVPEGWVPNRLIDLGSTSPFPDTVKLKQTNGWPTPVRYAALSHCWGAIQPLRLLKSNLHTLMGGIPLVDLPKTFQDAIHTTRKLGIQYLWIDCLCIIQDSSKDWDLESSLMTYVYGGCLLNIAAAASVNCTGGLFQSRPLSYLGPCFISVESQGEDSISQYQLWDQDLWPAEFESAKLNTRAWVMQERMLSPRTLAFTKAQLFWECRKKRACEEFPSEYPIERFERRQRDFEQPDLRKALKKHALNHHADSRLGDGHIPRLSLAWHNLVAFYSSKEMTFEQDKLVAISGLANLFARKLGTDYLAGLWKSTLLNDLLWEADTAKCDISRSLAYRAPSWSWASLECPVKYLPGHIKVNKVTVIDIDIHQVPGSNHFGRITRGHLRLQGKVFPGLSIAFDPENLCSLTKHSSQGTMLVASCTPDERVRTTEMQMEFLCLPIGSFWDSTRATGGWDYAWSGLVLLAERTEPSGYYKRWGAFKVKYSEFFDDPSNQAPVECYVDGHEDTIVII